MIHVDQTSPISATTLLASLKRAVEQELERKRRLGHYYVADENGQIVFQGDDAPVEKQKNN
ncbi:MAG: hypothetical protein IBX52_13460 [Bacterioplanes sp.]|nr:hypothetical protein [Bacterioplanes sp.]